MDSFIQLAKNRRSCRTFTAEKPSTEIVSQLLRTALMSPASKRSNPWHFILIDDKELLQKLADCKQHGSRLLANAPLAVVVLADPDKSDVWVEDTSIASIYIQLAAEDLNLGSCWVQIRKRLLKTGESSESYVRKLLDIPENLMVESIIAIGFKDGDKEPFREEDYLYDRLNLNRFGERLKLE